MLAFLMPTAPFPFLKLWQKVYTKRYKEKKKIDIKQQHFVVILLNDNSHVKNIKKVLNRFKDIPYFFPTTKGLKNIYMWNVSFMLRDIIFFIMATNIKSNEMYILSNS